MAGDVAAAEGHYRQALKVRPDHGPSLVNLATLLASGGRAADAERLVADTVKASPSRPGPRVAAAVIALRQRDLAGAEREAREALSLDERNVPAMLVLAQVFRGQGRLDTARFAVDNGLALEPGNALLHLERGHVLVALNERQEALFAYERAARLRPTLAEALEPYGRLLLERGFAVEARAALEMLVKLRPTSGLAWLHLGNAQRANKAYPAAEAAYRKALELDPALDEAHFNLGLLAIDNAVGDSDELVRLQKAVDSLKIYQSRGHPDAATKARLVEYIEATEKRISREAKRRERDRKRQADDAAKAAATPSAATPPPAATPAPAVAPPTVPETGAADDK
jgi:tetratricopeptide (TPR) repeat protein